MIRCEVIEQFTLKDFYKLNNIKRKSIDVKGTLFIGDTFECDEDMVKYLTGNNEQGKTVVKVIEVEPKIEQNKIELNASNITITDKDNKKINIKNKKTSKK